jgi:single-strand DNA-binding protein
LGISQSEKININITNLKTIEMVNKLTLIGRIGQIDVKDTKSGDKLTNLSVATSESYKDKNGEWQEKTQWHRCTIFKEFKADKGDLCYLEGKVEYREHDGKYYTDIIASYVRKLNYKGEKQTEQHEDKPSLPEPTNGQMVAMKIKVKKGELTMSQIQDKFDLTTEQLAQLRAEVPGEDDGELPF